VSQIESLTEQNLNRAMQLVTEAYELQAYRGHRSPDFEDDWFVQYGKFKSVAAGFPYVGLVGFNEKHHPIAISLIVHSEVYGDRTGVWEWFYVSPRATSSTFPLRVARETLREGQKEGLRSLVSYVSVEDRLLHRILRRLGMRPVEVEYRGELSELNPRMAGLEPEDGKQIRTERATPGKE